MALPSLILPILLAAPARCAEPAPAEKHDPAMVYSMAYTGAQKIVFTKAVDDLDARGMGLMSRSIWAQAIKVFNRSLTLMPRNPRALANRGVCYAVLNEPEEALRDFDKAVRIFPELQPAVAASMGQALVKRGRKLVDAGRNEDALRNFKAAAKLDAHNAAPWSEMSFMAYHAGQYDDCVFLAGRAIKADPGYSDSYGNRGACLHAKGQGQKALADLDIVVRLAPRHAAFYASRASVRSAMGQAQGAVEDARHAVRLDPSLADTMAPLLGPQRR